jgi:hypothetical protein
MVGSFFDGRGSGKPQTSMANGSSAGKLPDITKSVAQEPEGSSSHSKQPATGPYPELVESNPHPPSQSP